MKTGEKELSRCSVLAIYETSPSKQGTERDPPHREQNTWWKKQGLRRRGIKNIIIEERLINFLMFHYKNGINRQSHLLDFDFNH